MIFHNIKALHSNPESDCEPLESDQSFVFASAEKQSGCLRETPDCFVALAETANVVSENENIPRETQS